MTDNEIIKALDWHLNGENHCDECPLVTIKNSTTYCVDKLLKSALDLINRQKAEIEKKDKLLEIADKMQKGLNKEIAKLRKRNDELNATIKRLQKFKYYFDDLYCMGLEVSGWHYNGMLEPFDNFYDSAIKEMAGDSE